MPNRLSYSQLNKFKYCGKSWEFHYVHRVRPTAIPSPLIFGAAIGKAFEHLILDLKSEQDNTKNFTYTNKTAEITFDQFWNEQEVNGVPTNLKENPAIVYLKSDHDAELGATPWESMRVKGHLMIKCFREQLLPLIAHIHSTEELVELTSGSDSNIGYADAVVDIRGYDSPIVMDFKTSGRPYTKESVRESVQLSQYLYTLGDKYKTQLAGYAVFLKNIIKNRTKVCKECGFNGSGTKFKTCNNEIMLGVNFDAPVEPPKFERCNGEWQETISPECKFQLIIDTIPVEFQEQTVNEIGTINDQINSGVITKNLEACHNNYGKSCEFLNLCHNGSFEGLVVLEQKKN